MKIGRYTGSGIAIQEAQSVRGDVITAREAAGHELAKTQAVNEGLAALQGVAESFAAENKKQRDAMALERTQQQLAHAGNMLGQRRAEIEDDPDAAQKIIEQPDYWREAFEEAYRYAHSDLVKIEDPVQRQLARERLDLARAVDLRAMEQWSAQKYREGHVIEGSRLINEALQAKKPENAALVLDTVRGYASEKFVATTEAAIEAMRLEQKHEALAQPIIDGYKTGEGIGDALLIEFSEREGVTPEDFAAVKSLIGPHKETARIEERGLEAQRKLVAAEHGVLDQLAADRGEFYGDALLNARLGRYGDGPEAFTKAYTIMSAQARAFATQSARERLTDEMRTVLEAGDVWSGTHSDEAREVFDLLIAERTAGMGEDEALQATISMVRDTGLLPKSLVHEFSQAGAQAEAITPEYVQAVAALNKDMATEIDLTGLDQRSKDIAETAWGLIRERGLDPGTIANYLREWYYPTETIDREARERAYAKGEADRNAMRDEYFSGEGFPIRKGGFNLLDKIGLGLEWEDLPSEYRADLEMVWEANFKRSFMRYGNVENAAIAAANGVLAQRQFTNLGSSDPNTLRLAPVPPVLAGDVSWLNEQLFDLLQRELDSGVGTIGTLDGSTVLWGDDVDIREQVVEFKVKSTTHLGPDDPDSLTLVPFVNGMPERIEVRRTDPDTGEEVVSMETREITIPRAALEQVAKREAARQEILDEIDELDGWRARARGEPWSYILDQKHPDTIRKEQRLQELHRMLAATPKLEIEFTDVNEAVEEAPEAPTGGTASAAENAPQEASVWTPAAVKNEVRRQAALLGLDPDFAEAVAWKESSFRTDAVSQTGYKGVMQLHEKFAYAGYRRGVPKFDPEKDIFDPQENIRVGVSLLKTLYDLYDGDPVLTTRAYNAGVGTIGNWKGAGSDLNALTQEAYDYPYKVSDYLKRFGKGFPVDVGLPPRRRRNLK